MLVLGQGCRVTTETEMLNEDTNGSDSTDATEGDSASDVPSSDDSETAGDTGHANETDSFATDSETDEEESDPVLKDPFGLWTWMGGIREPWNYLRGKCWEPVFGNMGSAQAENTPSRRLHPAFWRTKDGALWLFGGRAQVCGEDEIGLPSDEFHSMNDLWRFDPITLLWTWMSGSSSTSAQEPNFGEMGVPSLENTPPPRQQAAFWTDDDGKLWLFGGTSDDGNLNDLWRFDPGDNTWTWVGGSSTVNDAGNDGTFGEFSSKAQPSARVVRHSWKDTDGRFLLYGGGDGFHEMWRYDPSINQWAFIYQCDVGEARFTASGTTDPDNNPEDTSSSSVSSTADGDLFWYHDGVLEPDVWRFDIKLLQWEWIRRGDGSSQTTYGTRGVASEDVTPGWWFKGSTVNDSQGYLWLIGGAAVCHDECLSYSSTDLMWRLTPETKNWVFVQGHSDWWGESMPVRGELNVEAETNDPGAIEVDAIWVDEDDSFWMYTIGEMWRYRRLAP
jgi:hypothetical protein